MNTGAKGQHTGRDIYWPERNLNIQIAHLLGTGGEGEVYAVAHHPDLAVKIYHQNRQPTGLLADKLSAMENINLDFSGLPPTTLPRVAWPTKIIKQPSTSQVIGIVMPMVDRTRTIEISHILNPTIRQITLNKHQVSESSFEEKRISIAQNIITTVRALHNANCVIGDVNDDNIHVEPTTGQISIVDCDAFQITDQQSRTIHRCKVGREQFTPPELLDILAQDRCDSKTCINTRDVGIHKPGYACLSRQPEHDMFGISVIIFKLFMNGAHPYSQRTPPNSVSAKISDRISQKQYPYDRNNPGHAVTPINQKLYSQLDSKLKELFYRTFT